MAELTLLYVTCADGDEAKTIARVLVGERLVACANILGPVTSVYRWDGAVKEQEEVAMLLKARRDSTVLVTERIKALHSYDLPCVVGLPIQHGNPDFLAWLQRETDRGEVVKPTPADRVAPTCSKSGSNSFHDWV